MRITSGRSGTLFTTTTLLEHYILSTTPNLVYSQGFTTTFLCSNELGGEFLQVDAEALRCISTNLEGLTFIVIGDLDPSTLSLESHEFDPDQPFDVVDEIGDPVLLREVAVINLLNNGSDLCLQGLTVTVKLIIHFTFGEITNDPTPDIRIGFGAETGNWRLPDDGFGFERSKDICKPSGQDCNGVAIIQDLCQFTAQILRRCN